MNVQKGMLLAGACALLFAAATARADDEYTSRIGINDVPKSADSDQAESPMGRLEASKAALGGNVTPELRDAVLAEAARIQKKQVPVVGGAWNEIGPLNITRFQNEVNRAKDNSGRMRTILPDPRPQNADTV